MMRYQRPKVVDASQVDHRPGYYYVTAVDAGRYWLLSGPYIDDHGAALADVNVVREIAQESNPRAWFYSYGTARLEEPNGLGSTQKAGVMPISRSALAAGWDNRGGAA